jgi:hypothetical protein
MAGERDAGQPTADHEQRPQAEDRRQEHGEAEGRPRDRGGSPLLEVPGNADHVRGRGVEDDDASDDGHPQLVDPGCSRHQWGGDQLRGHPPPPRAGDNSTLQPRGMPRQRRKSPPHRGSGPSHRQRCHPPAPFPIPAPPACERRQERPGRRGEQPNPVPNTGHPRAAGLDSPDHDAPDIATRRVILTSG